MENISTMGVNIIYNNCFIFWCMTSIGEQINKLSEYGISISVVSGTMIISLSYPKNWTILNPDDKSTNILSEDGRTYYWSNDGKTSENIFSLIKETIEHNKDIEKKSILFKEKIKELQNIFVNESYEELKNIEFKFKRKYKRKPKLEAKEETVENTQDEVEVNEENSIANEDIHNNNEIIENND